MYLLDTNHGPKAKQKRRKMTAANLGFSDHDLWIASTAIQHNLILVSADRDFQRMQEASAFQLESWL
ncbi:MAG: type II toxin-antitoxin system VapC family toxin [Synechococcales cyanobacterium CRU_2_2]|nr:type II toxin-antitoxin system VapC family toxin [Synechococcales cyanobacterium CRU_2_2]